MANGMMKALILVCAACFVGTATAALTGRVEAVSIDLRGSSRLIALRGVEGMQLNVAATVTSDGAIYDVSKWQSYLWYGNESTGRGVVFTNVRASRGVVEWTVPPAQMATNGRFTVQIASRPVAGGSLQEWARGALEIKRNLSSLYLPMTFGVPAYATVADLTSETLSRTSGDAALVSSNAAARAAIVAEAGERVAGDTAARTNHVAAVEAEAGARIAGDNALISSNAAARAAITAEALLRAQGDAASIAAFATNRVTRLDGTSNSWQTVENGISYIYTETPDTNRVRIVSTDAEFNGPPVGTELVSRESAFPAWGTGIWGGLYYLGEWTLLDNETGGADFVWQVTSAFVLPQTVNAGNERSIGSCVIDYGTRTNRTALAAEPTILIIADKVQANTDAIAAIPLPPTNVVQGFTMWDSGSNRYWRVSVTNLRVFLWGDL